MGATILLIVISAVFSQNFILVKFLGICPFLGVSKKVNSAFSMGIAVTLVMILATLVTWPLYFYVMVPLKIEYLEIIFFIFVIAALVQMLETFPFPLSLDGNLPAPHYNQLRHPRRSGTAPCERSFGSCFEH